MHRSLDRIKQRPLVVFIHRKFLTWNKKGLELLYFIAYVFFICFVLLQSCATNSLYLLLRWVCGDSQGGKLGDSLVTADFSN